MTVPPFSLSWDACADHCDSRKVVVEALDQLRQPLTDAGIADALSSCPRSDPAAAARYLEARTRDLPVTAALLQIQAGLARHPQRCACSREAWGRTHRAVADHFEQLGGSRWVLDEQHTGRQLPDCPGELADFVLYELIGYRKPFEVVPDQLHLAWDGQRLTFAGSRDGATWQVTGRDVGPVGDSLAYLLEDEPGMAERGTAGHFVAGLDPQVVTVAYTLARDALRTLPAADFPRGWTTVTDLTDQVIALHRDLPAAQWAAVVAFSADGWNARLPDLVASAGAAMAAPPRP